MGRDKYLRQSLGTQHARIKESRVLMVGAGGIGCELLKNLVLTGYGEIHIVDLDTIDLSNLNRQFLFRHEHIKKSKALVAKESASRFNPNVKIEAYHANIKDAQFNVSWFKKFDIVFNALDNLEARRHVNKLSLAADVPLIDAGTTGWNGQVTVIKKGVSECYDCVQKDPPKTFPVCTIRSTPSQPIHCIVWAKSYLFTEIYGISEDDAPELDHSEDTDNAPEIQKLKEETQALKRIRKCMGTDEFNKLVFDKVFKEDIDRLRGMEDAWKTRKAPEPLSYDKLQEEASGIDSDVAQQDQTPWTLQQNFVVFKDSLQRLSKRVQELRNAAGNGAKGDAPPVLTFDKDDADTLDFVTASANLRSHIFGIDMQSKFDLKQMAGNIIPAIATTNASVAGLCILQAFKIMRDPPDFGKARSVFLSRLPTLSVTAPEPLGRPNPDCSTCSIVHASIPTDLTTATLDDLANLLKVNLDYTDDFSISTDAGVIYDPDLEDNLPKKLAELGVEENSFLTVRDEEDENPRSNLILSISAITERADGQAPVSLPGKIEIPRKPSKRSAPTNGTASNGVKRKRDAVDAEMDEGDHVAKKGKVPAKSDAEAIVIEDDEGFIHLSDDE